MDIVVRMAETREELSSKVSRAIADRASSDKLWAAMARGRANREDGMTQFGLDAETLRREDRRIKAGRAADPETVERFAVSVTRNGGHVFVAATGTDAVRYVADLVRANGADLVVKSKSLTTEEIEFNRRLLDEGIRSVETDLGELIVQLNRERPVHLVAPAAHLSNSDVAAIFSRELNKSIPPDPETILKEVRAYLRPLFLSAKVGVTGGNIGVAETGSIILETNEGNARLVGGIPRVHVVIIGMEKIISSWEDAAQLVRAHAISSTGQGQTVYVSIVTQRPPLGASPGERELHVVILDNGRSKMRQDPSLSDALNCIRCGACMNVCPTYGVVGGHVFGHLYPGPIGIPWTAGVHGYENTGFADLCISCGLCKNVCPVDIDMPLMIAKVKEANNAREGEPRVNSFFASSERLAKVASAMAPVSNWVTRSSPGRYMLEKVAGVDRRRTLPRFSRRRLRRILKGTPQGSGTSGRLVYFPDIQADYCDPELGYRAVRLLRSLGYEVEVPDLRWSGMPHISYGEVKEATKVAESNLRALEPFVSAGYGIVSTEPTATYMLKQTYPSLVPGELSTKAAAVTSGLFALVADRLPSMTLSPSLPKDTTVGFHIPCQERSLTQGKPAIRFLERAGYKVKVVETGTCCGIAGTFGMKRGALGYELSMAVGSRLFELFASSGAGVVASESSVCAIQITDGTKLKVLHPLYLVERL